VGSVGMILLPRMIISGVRERILGDGRPCAQCGNRRRGGDRSKGRSGETLNTGRNPRGADQAAQARPGKARGESQTSVAEIAPHPSILVPVHGRGVSPLLPLLG